MTRSTKKPGAHTWAFTARFRRGAYGWKSSKLAVRRVREAVKEIRGVARRDPVLGAEGAILFLERVSAGLEHVDSSSGALGNAVNRAVEALVSVIADAPADEATREAWLERLFEAHREDVIPYIESLADHWGELCVAPKLASEWADRLLDTTRMVLGPDRRPGGFFHGTSACLSALYHARRYEELVELLEGERFWAYKRWAVKALAAMDRADDAIRCAEACRGSWTPDGAVDALCEEILLDAGRVGEAYARYGLWANRRNTYLATFRAVAKKYPHKEPAQLLADLVDSTPGEEGKWFATASRRSSTTRPSRWLASRRAIPGPWRAPRGTSRKNGPRSPWRPGCRRCAGWRPATATRSPARTCTRRIGARWRPPGGWARWSPRENVSTSSWTTTDPTNSSFACSGRA